ncbi:hypothetical protein GCM10023321_25990 [Pseudonocardia eucalypti]|uniref:DUF433 domain-containing protein n=1 Tax=Pseudonocardia eucalypti TaxID=648755 RepID=A0ABP9PYH0_9PSEU
MISSTVNHEYLNLNQQGHLVVRGTDLCIAVVLRWLGKGTSLTQIVAAHGGKLTVEKLQNAINEAAELVDPQHASDMTAAKPESEKAT